MVIVVVVFVEILAGFTGVIRRSGIQKIQNTAVSITDSMSEKEAETTKITITEVQTEIQTEPEVEVPETTTEVTTVSTPKTNWNGTKLNAYDGTIQGPSGKETYYNLPMQGVVSIMRGIGNNDPYWVREDGVKMLGDYVMVAANLNVRPRGTIVETSLGTGIVCDTGGFAANNPYQLDVAVTW